MVAIMCGRCYRPATTTVYFRPWWRRKPIRHEVCATCLPRHYSRRARKEARRRAA
jgi:hypothetical protein